MKDQARLLHLNNFDMLETCSFFLFFCFFVFFFWGGGRGGGGGGKGFRLKLIIVIYSTCNYILFMYAKCTFVYRHFKGLECFVCK